MKLNYLTEATDDPAFYRFMEQHGFTHHPGLTVQVWSKPIGSGIGCEVRIRKYCNTHFNLADDTNRYVCSIYFDGIKPVSLLIDNSDNIMRLCRQLDEQYVHLSQPVSQADFYYRVIIYTITGSDSLDNLKISLRYKRDPTKVRKSFDNPLDDYDDEFGNNLFELEWKIRLEDLTKSSLNLDIKQAVDKRVGTI